MTRMRIIEAMSKKLYRIERRYKLLYWAGMSVTIPWIPPYERAGRILVELGEIQVERKR